MEGMIAEVTQTHGIAVASLLAAVVALWKTLRSSHEARVSGLETAVAECQTKHKECEEGKRQLTMALVDVVDGRDEAAREKCQKILRGEV